MAMILITHDLGVVAKSCSEAVVMYSGKVVEQAPVMELFDRPRHPYTSGLLASIPRVRDEKLKQLPVIEGMVPDPLHLPEGCRFAERCEKVKQECRRSQPQLQAIGHEHSKVACYVPN